MFPLLPIPYPITAPRNYEWLVVYDPEGCYTNHLFRTIDVDPYNTQFNYWPNGTVFQHCKSPEYKIVRKGKIYTGFHPLGCKAALALYADWKRIDQALTDRGILHLERNQEYTQAIRELRNHLKHCPDCLGEIRKIIRFSEKVESR